MLLPVMRIMKPVPKHYRFLMVHHQDNLWKRHRFEAPEALISKLMHNTEPLYLLLEKRKKYWLMHCHFRARETINAVMRRRTDQNNETLQTGCSTD